MSRVTVRSFPGQGGFTGHFRGGPAGKAHFWSQDGDVVDFIDGEEDLPPVDGRRQIGTKTQAELRDDSRISVDGSNAAVSAVASGVELDTLKTENATLRAQVEALMVENATLKAGTTEVKPESTGKKK